MSHSTHVPRVRRFAGLLPLAAALIALCCAALPTQAALVRTTVPYTLDGVTMQGYLVYDDATTEKRPGVLVVHEWWGLNAYAKSRADELATMGYVAFAADMYGDGQVGTTREEAGALASKVRGTPLMGTRALAALETLKAQPQVDAARVAAIGFCFGGTAVLQLAYLGADLLGVVAFHGSLVPLPEDAAAGVKAKVLILHGTIDPNVSPESVKACLESLEKGKVDYQLVAYAGAVHAFTNPAAGNDPSKGAAYNEKAAKRSWIAMQSFFAELF